MKQECNETGRPMSLIFVWFHLCSKTATPSRSSRKIPNSGNPFEHISKSANLFQYLASPCPKVRSLCETSVEVRTFCESAPKVLTFLKFLRARAQKRKPFLGLRRKREPFQGVGEHVPESASPRRIFATNASPFECLARSCPKARAFGDSARKPVPIAGPRCASPSVTSLRQKCEPFRRHPMSTYPFEDRRRGMAKSRNPNDAFQKSEPLNVWAQTSVYVVFSNFGMVLEIAPRWSGRRHAPSVF